MENLISVIIPVYNVSEFLPRCLDSVINQTYKNLEIILVDDGSTDDSGIICDEYAKKDDRIIVIHQENLGVSSARNSGIEISKGSYIGFVDSDDVIESNMYSLLMDNIISTNSDISCCQIQTKNINGSTIPLDDSVSRLYSKQEIVEGFFFDGTIKEFIVSPCNKIFRKDVIGNIRFKPYALAEDFLFIFEVLVNSKTIYYDSTVGYFYIHRENSAMTSSFSQKRFDYIDAITEIETICKKNYNHVIQIKAHQWVFGHILITYRSIIINGLKTQFIDKTIEYKNYLLANRHNFKYLNIKRKIDYILSLYLPFMYKFIKVGK